MRTSQKCSHCKGKFKDVGNNLICPKCQTVATKMFLEWWFNNKRYYRSGFDSYMDALRHAIKIETEIENYNFKPEKYIDQNKQVLKKYRFSIAYEQWLKQKKLDLERGDLAPSYYEEVKQYGKEFISFFKDMDIRAMNSLDIKKYRNSLPSSHSPKTFTLQISIYKQ